MESRLFSLTYQFTPESVYSSDGEQELTGSVDVSSDSFLGTVEDSFDKQLTVIGARRNSEIYMISGSKDSAKALWVFREWNRSSGLYRGELYHQIELHAEGYHTFHRPPEVVSKQDQNLLIEGVRSEIHNYRSHGVPASGSAVLELRLKQ